MTTGGAQAAAGTAGSLAVVMQRNTGNLWWAKWVWGLQAIVIMPNDHKGYLVANLHVLWS